MKGPARTLRHGASQSLRKPSACEPLTLTVSLGALRHWASEISRDLRSAFEPSISAREIQPAAAVQPVSRPKRPLFGGTRTVTTIKSDIEIARAATMKPIAEVAAKVGIPADALVPYGTTKAKVILRAHRQPEGRQGRQAHPRHRHQPDAGRRRQDDDDGRSRRRPQPHRQEGDDVPARALARAVLRRQGRRGRRRLCPGRADGGHQPPLHRRLPRHHVGAQPAVGDDRQSHLLGQQPRLRHAAASPGSACST